MRSLRVIVHYHSGREYVDHMPPDTIDAFMSAQDAQLVETVEVVGTDGRSEFYQPNLMGIWPAREASHHLGEVTEDWMGAAEAGCSCGWSYEARSRADAMQALDTHYKGNNQ